jgi:hypothetical protein
MRDMKSLELIQRKSRRAVSLLEIVVATMITGAMLVASLNSVGAVFQTHLANSLRLTGPGLAHELMAEIMSMPYEDPAGTSTTIGTDTGESLATRSTLDDVDDYHGYSTTGMRSKAGTLRSGYTSWQQQANVTWIEVLTGLPWILGDTGLKKITVTITSPDGETTQLTAFRYEEGMLEQAPLVDTTAVTWIGAELQLTGQDLPVRMGVNLTNHTPDSN